MTDEIFCRGCGCYYAVHGAHRADCTRDRVQPLPEPEELIPVRVIYGDTCSCGKFLARHDSGLCEWCTATEMANQP